MVDMIPLGEVAQINPRMPAGEAKDPSRPVDFVPMAALSESGKIVPNGARPISEVQKGYTYFAEGDVLVAKITPCFENGKAALVKELPNRIGFGSTEFHVLRPGERVDGQYLFYLLWNDVFRKKAASRMKGAAGQKRVPTDFFKEFLIPLPPLPEQKRIAAILDKADAIRRKRQEAIELSEQFLRSVFLEMFGDPVTNPKGWEPRKLSELVTVKSGQVKPLEEPFLSMLHVGSDNIEKCSGRLDGMKTPKELGLISGKYLFSSEDILYSKIRPYLNKVALPKFDGLCSADIYPLTPLQGEATKEFVAFMLRSSHFLKYAESQSSRTSIPKINRPSLLSYEAFVPPYEVQEEFSAISRVVDGSLVKQQQALSEGENLFDSLSQRSFKGEL